MLKILLESFLLEIAQNNLNADKEINYLFETLNSNFTTDLQKLIKESNMDIQEFKILAFNIINSEEFAAELASLNITIPTPVNTLETAYNEVVNTLIQNDYNSTWGDILEDNDNNYNEAIKELKDCIITCIEAYENEKELYNYYNELLNKIKEVL